MGEIQIEEIKITIEKLKKEIVEKQHLLDILINQYQELSGIDLETTDQQ
jgi:hypothetical protein